MSTTAKALPTLTPEYARKMIAEGYEAIELFKLKAASADYIGDVHRKLIVQYEADIARLEAYLKSQQR